MDEARGVCKDRSMWRSVVSAYPHGKNSYVCMYVSPDMFNSVTATEKFLMVKAHNTSFDAGIEPKTLFLAETGPCKGYL